jgi:hypothetical protein
MEARTALMKVPQKVFETWPEVTDIRSFIQVSCEGPGVTAAPRMTEAHDFIYVNSYVALPLVLSDQSLETRTAITNQVNSLNEKLNQYREHALYSITLDYSRFECIDGTLLSTHVSTEDIWEDVLAAGLKPESAEAAASTTIRDKCDEDVVTFIRRIERLRSALRMSQQERAALSTPKKKQPIQKAATSSSKSQCAHTSAIADGLCQR